MTLMKTANRSEVTVSGHKVEIIKVVQAPLCSGYTAARVLVPTIPLPAL